MTSWKTHIAHLRALLPIPQAHQTQVQGLLIIIAIVTDYLSLLFTMIAMIDIVTTLAVITITANIAITTITDIRCYFCCYYYYYFNYLLLLL